VICVLRRDKRLGCDENVHGGLEAMLARPGSPQGVHHLAALVTAQSGVRRVKPVVVGTQGGKLRLSAPNWAWDRTCTARRECGSEGRRRAVTEARSEQLLRTKALRRKRAAGGAGALASMHTGTRAVAGDAVRRACVGASAAEQEAESSMVGEGRRRAACVHKRPRPLSHVHAGNVASEGGSSTPRRSGDSRYRIHHEQGRAVERSQRSANRSNCAGWSCVYPRHAPNGPSAHITG
jgi:hypothetical protein